MSDPKDTQPGRDTAPEGAPVEGVTTPAAPQDEAGAFSGGQSPRLLDSRGPAPRSRASHLQDLVDEPAKVMRIGTMLKQLLDEVKSAPLDDAARARLAEIHERSIKEPEDGTPSDAELRIAQAQLVGWLEGLFHGIQTAIAAQHAAREHAAAQLQLRQLPPGTMIAPGVIIGENGEPQRAAEPQPGDDPSQPAKPADPDHGPGQYLKGTVGILQRRTAGTQGRRRTRQGAV